ncbi:scarecrow-like protein 30 [Argentina anserina]|uniref:scarecrow-like protein 30 n=1 Tax=Argentina anserina TaxID=57926 RepID=UPI0021767282|nr:scarecrow-like protein 30 [Potentilla anserina]
MPLFVFPALGGLLFGYDIGATSDATISLTSAELSSTTWFNLIAGQLGLVHCRPFYLKTLLTRLQPYLSLYILDLTSLFGSFTISSASRLLMQCVAYSPKSSCRFSVPMESFLSDQGSVSNNSSSDDNHELINPLFIPANLDLPGDCCTSLNPASDEYAGDNYDDNTPVLRYISDILLEEDIEDKPCMIHDCLALQAAAKSFYDVIHQKDSTTLDQSYENPDDYKESFFSTGGAIYGKTDGVADVPYSLAKCHPDTSLVSNSISKLQSLGNSRRVEEENNWHAKFKILKAKRFQPMLQGPQTHTGLTSVYEQRSDGYNSKNGSETKKDRRRLDDHCLEEWRSNKQSLYSVAYSTDDSELQEMFDKLMLCQTANCKSVNSSSLHESCNEGSKYSEESKHVRSKRRTKEDRVVDLRTMLIQCAQAVASYDQRNASVLLKQIRQHSSPYGDATQRLAHYFADGLQVRLADTRAPLHSYIVGPKILTVEILKGHQTSITTFPFWKLTQFFANMTIIKLAEKATSLHIIDFGISYGFQWPSLIQRLSERHGGPPKLHITAIELPQPGFRPTERVEETGRRLAKYSRRFGVSFEFQVIAQKWETIGLDDLKIDRNKLIVVNCLHRLRHVPEVTMIGNSPRDDVLKLIRKINPEIFIHGVVNGAHNSSFFLTRFKQAISYFNAHFDIYEATMPCEDKQRLLFERVVLGGEIMNVVACEGLEIVERPETYQKWQVRNVRAGFKQLPLDQELLMKVKNTFKSIGYHNDFSIDEDENWMLHGWRGRVLFALSFWKGV